MTSPIMIIAAGIARRTIRDAVQPTVKLKIRTYNTDMSLDDVKVGRWGLLNPLPSFIPIKQQV